MKPMETALNNGVGSHGSGFSVRHEYNERNKRDKSSSGCGNSRRCCCCCCWRRTGVSCLARNVEEERCVACASVTPYSVAEFLFLRLCIRLDSSPCETGRDHERALFCGLCPLVTVLRPVVGALYCRSLAATWNEISSDKYLCL